MAYTPTFKRWDDIGVAMPNMEISEGIRPPLRATIAPYLPLRHYDTYYRLYYVAIPGTPMAFDSLGFLVPAGLAIDLAAAIAAGNVSAAVHEYSDADEAEGVLDAQGAAVTSGDKVVASMISAASGVVGATRTTATMTVSKFVGLAQYGIYQASSNSLTNYGTSTTVPVWDPTRLRNHNLNSQDRVAVVCDYMVEFAIVNSYAPILSGISVFDASFGSAGRGEFVKVNVQNNLVLADCSTDNFCDIIGQILVVDTNFPKGLERVRSRWGANVQGFQSLDRASGTATEGYPPNMHYADTKVGTVWVNLITR